MGWSRRVLGREGLLQTGIAIAIGTICACATTVQVARVPQPPLGRFEPRAATAARKTKLQSATPQLNELLAARAERSGATAAVVGIVLDGELAYQAGFGWLDAASSARPDANTVFRIGSVSKSFAATAIVELRDAGKLSLDDPAVRYVPELGKLRGAAAGWSPITIRHLLTMTSGLPYDDVWGPVSFGLDERELQHLFDQGVTLASEPGARYAYSNLGYAILGQIVARISGQPFRDYVSRHVLEPLGMASTTWAPAARGMAIGYHRQQGQLALEPHPDDGVFAPAGGVYSTLHDMARYVAFQLSAYEVPGAPEAAPLLRASVREMHRGQAWLRWGHDVPVASYDEVKGMKLMASGYGFGWVNHTTCDYEGIVQHGGYEPGYFASLRLFPAHRMAMISLSTTAPTGDYETLRGVLGVLKEQGLLDSAEAPTAALQQARVNVDRLLARWDDALARTSFDAVSLRYAFFSKIGDDLQKLSRDHGACEPDGELTASSATQASWRLRCTRGAIDLSLWLSPTSPPRIQHLTWKEYPASNAPSDAPIVIPPRRAPNSPCSVD